MPPRGPRSAGCGAAAAMSDWEADSDEAGGVPARSPFSLTVSAAALRQLPVSSSQSRASVKSGRERRSAERRWEVPPRFGGKEPKPQGAKGFGGPGLAVPQQRSPRPAAGQAEDAAVPLCFHLDNALVGILIGNSRCASHPAGCSLAGGGGEAWALGRFVRVGLGAPRKCLAAFSLPGCGRAPAAAALFPGHGRMLLRDTD